MLVSDQPETGVPGMQRRWRTSSQCSWRSTGVMWSHRWAPVTCVCACVFVCVCVCVAHLHSVAPARRCHGNAVWLAAHCDLSVAVATDHHRQPCQISTSDTTHTISPQFTVNLPHQDKIILHQTNSQLNSQIKQKYAAFKVALLHVEQ